MIVDTSALVAILQNEPEASRLVIALEGDPVRRVATATLVEAGIVMHARYGDHGERELDLLIQRAGIDGVPVTVEHAELARSAFRRYGKGRHDAALNFGDCFSYALSMAMGEPLLFVGDDYSRTDVLVASY